MSQSHWTDNGIEQAVATAPPPGPTLSVAEFLQNLSQSGLLPPAEVATLKEQADETSQRHAWES